MDFQNMTDSQIIGKGLPLVDWQDNDEIKILIMNAVIDNYSSNSNMEAMYNELADLMSNSGTVSVIEHFKELI